VGEVANSLALYLRMVAQSVRAQLQYRISFLFMAFGSFVASIVEAVGIWALFERFGSLGTWRLAEVAFLYGIVNAAFAACEALARGFDIFARDFVKTGAFDRVLLRPRTTVLQLAGHELQLHRIGRFAQGVLVLAWAIWMLDVDWQPWRIALLLLTFFAALAFFYGLFVIQATLSFWTTESLELINTLTYGGTETAQYPLAIYRPWFRRLFTYVVPLGCISYFPSVAILGVEDPLGSSLAFQVSSPFAGFLFLALSLGFWRIGIRRYTSTGS
jgi:ABC-2 type transport system permease protein